jgi:hypothetical protein
MGRTIGLKRARLALKWSIMHDLRVMHHLVSEVLKKSPDHAEQHLYLLLYSL